MLVYDGKCNRKHKIGLPQADGFALTSVMRWGNGVAGVVVEPGFEIRDSGNAAFEVGVINARFPPTIPNTAKIQWSILTMSSSQTRHTIYRARRKIRLSQGDH